MGNQKQGKKGKKGKIKKGLMQTRENQKMKNNHQNQPKNIVSNLFSKLCIFITL